MQTCLALTSDRFELPPSEDIDGGDGWRLETFDDAEALASHLSNEPAGIVLYPSGVDPDLRGRMFDRVRTADGQWFLVAAVPDRTDAARAELRGGADDVVSRARVASEALFDELELRLERLESTRRTGPNRESFRQHASQLVAINAVTDGIGRTLDWDAVARRGLWVFAGMGLHDCAALYELTPPPPIGRSRDESDPEPELELAGSYTRRDRPPLGSVALGEGWSTVVFEQELVSLESRPSEGTYPGLAQFWEASPDGRVTLVPLRSNRGPLGVLVLTTSAGPSRRNALARDALRAMADQFAAALENARLFERVRATAKSLEQTQDKLVHTEKYAAVGVMASEVAHEINDPASFVISNLSVLSEYTSQLERFHRELESRLTESPEQTAGDVDELKEEHDIEYLEEDMESLLSRSLTGMQRIHQFVQDLRYLSRDTGAEPGWVDVEDLLDASANLVRHRAKFRACVEKDYGDPPQVLSDASLLSQVFLNLMIHAVHAIEIGDVDGDEIRIGTAERDDRVVVTIADTGGGIPEDEQSTLFEPIVSSRPSEESTGFGLAISRDLIDSLGGDLEYETTPGEGTEFRVAIPVRSEALETDGELTTSGLYEAPPASDGPLEE